MTAGLVLLMLLTTRLRLVGFAVMALAIVPLLSARPPDIVIAEEGKLVALSAPNDALTVNRATASRFTLDNWQQGYGAIQVLTPAKNGASPADGQFECVDGVCLAREPGGLIVAYTDDPTKKSTACAEGDIVVLAFTGPAATCDPGDVLVITAQELALRGSAEIRLGESNADPPSGLDAAALAVEQLHARLQSAKVTYAVGSPQRPWNAYRVFSRTARNLEEQKPQRRAAKTKPPGDDQEDPIRQ